jgi:hypothetical protein
MAKIVKVKVTKTDMGNGRIKFNYPTGYDATKLNVVAWEHVGDKASVDSRGNAYEYCIGVVSDIDAPAFLVSEDITGLTQGDANTLGSIYRPQIVRVTDEQAVIGIIAKQRASQALTQEEDDIINPDNPAIGINKSPAFSDLLTNTLSEVVE